MAINGIYKDKKGIARFIVCFLILFYYNAMRDYLLVGVCAIATKDAETDTEASYNSTTEGTTDSNTVGTYLDALPLVEGDGVPLPRSWDVYALDDDEDWSPAMVGSSIAIFHWSSALVIIACIWSFSKWFDLRVVGLSLLFGGILSELTKIIEDSSSYALLTLRLLQGTIQGVSLPFALWMLRYIIIRDLDLPFFVVFFAPWLGSMCGMALAGLDNPFISTYVFGLLSCLTGISIFFLHSDAAIVKDKAIFKPFEEFSTKWSEIFSSIGVWVCLAVEVSAVWSVHTFIFGLSLTLNFQFHDQNMVGKVCIAMVIGGILNRAIIVISFRYLKFERFSKTTLYRCIISIGSLVTIVCLCICGTLGLDYEAALMSSCIVGLAFGVSLMHLGVRLNVHDLAPTFNTSLLLVFSVANLIGGGFSIFLFPIISEIDEDSTGDDNDGSWIAAWLYPMGLVAIAGVVYVIFLSTTILDHQKVPVRLEMQNGGPLKESSEFDGKSFRSLKSAMTFKSFDRSKGRTTSFNTLKEDTEKDYGSVHDTTNEECWSAAHEAESDMISIKSSNNSFNSATEEAGKAGKNFGVILSARNLDTTRAWLTTHHNIEKQDNSENEIEWNKNGDTANIKNTLLIDTIW